MSNNDLTVLDGLTKRVYGKGVHQAVPDNVKFLYDLIPFTPNQEQLGDSFVEAVNLAIEQGVTFGGGKAGIVTLNSPIAGKTKQAIVDASMIAFNVQISWDLVAKASGSNTAQSFEKGVTQAIDNTLISHRRFQTIQMLYGTDNIGVISSGTASATQTITNASCAPAVFYGSDNMQIDIYDPTLTTKRNGSPLNLNSYSVDSDSGSRTLTFGASVTTTTNDVVVPTGWVASTAFVMTPGLSTIAGQLGGTLFSLSQTTFPMFQGAVFDNGSAALSLTQLDRALGKLLLRGYNGRVTLLLHPRTFSNLVVEQNARVQLINGNARGTARVGFDEYEIMTSTGAPVTARVSPWIKEGEAYGVPDDGSLRRIGAVDIKLGGPMQEPNWQRLIAQTGYYLPTYSLQTPFTAEPWKLLKIKNIVNT